MNRPLMQTLPTSDEVTDRLTNALREVRLLKLLLRLARLSDDYKHCDRSAGTGRRGPSERRAERRMRRRPSAYASPAR